MLGLLCAGDEEGRWLSQDTKYSCCMEPGQEIYSNTNTQTMRAEAVVFSRVSSVASLDHHFEMSQQLFL